MHYIVVLWPHEHANDPVRLVSELDLQRFELRKLEFFRDGTVGFACSSSSTEGTRLGLAPVPTLEEINGQSEFEGSMIGKEEFEALWRQHAPPAI